MTTAEAIQQWRELNQRINNAPLMAQCFTDGQMKLNGNREALVRQRDAIFNENRLWDNLKELHA